MKLLCYTTIIFLLLSCGNKSSTLFTELDRSKTGIDFRNLLAEDETLNVSHYIYFYNGAGVAIGDINNDGLQDIFFTGNMVKNRLYLNKGNLEFENITAQSHVSEKQGWCTGASMVDINQDGLLDIYICRSADDNPEKRKNLLFINNGDLTFSEQAEKYGLADNGYSTQASFFDYDKDGDLDCFVLNHSIAQYSLGVAENPAMKNMKEPAFASRLYRNDNGTFVNVSDSAGIISNVLSFGLGIAVSDFNNDGWPDMYISNDFQESDYFYLNNKNGTFTESFGKCMDQASLNSMGSDAADFNNDGKTDLITLDMLPESNSLQKTHSSGNSFDKTSLFVSRGFQPQYMRNMLQKNNGDGTFSEIAQLAGVSNTDWSWSALFCDFDGDTNKDLFISNGFVKDFSDLDFINFSSNTLAKSKTGEKKASLKETLKQMPEVKISNYIFRNDNGKKFINETSEWGIDKPVVSSGSAYADLDNDGDMDLVVNNSNDYASVYENQLNKLQKKNYIKIVLEGSAQNKNGIGTKVKLFTSGKELLQEQFPVRGYQSSVELNLNFGLDTMNKIDSLLVIWPDDKYQVIRNVQANQTLKLKASDAKQVFTYMKQESSPLFTSETLDNVVHKENQFNDFTVQRLLPNYLSRQGPGLAVADINGDGKKDLFIGNGKGFSNQLFIQSQNGFTPVSNSAISQNIFSETTAAEFFDADGDGDMDLYIAHGGYEFTESDSLLQDELFINDGKGNFSLKKDALPPLHFSKSCVKAADIDNDGDSDLFIGGRVIPGKYPLAPPSKILLNDGKGNFKDGTKTVAPFLDSLGMVTDAVWIDVNNDKIKDLVVAGEWMPIKVFVNNGQSLSDASGSFIKFASNGWWNRIVSTDMDDDGDMDLIIGNAGLNTQFSVNEKEPMELTYGDFDKNGSLDPILCYYVQGISYPLFSRDDIAEQLPFLKKKFLSYKNYSTAILKDIFSPDQLSASRTLEATTMETIYLENTGKEFIVHHLPPEAQYAPVYGIVAADFNGDNKKDILLAGNNSWTRVKFGRYSANHGTLLSGDGKGNFMYIPQDKSGLKINGNTRNAALINENKIVLGINDGKAIFLSFDKK